MESTQGLLLFVSLSSVLLQLDQIGWFEASLPFAQCSYTCTENAPHKIEKDTQACTIVLMMIAIIV